MYVAGVILAVHDIALASGSFDDVGLAEALAPKCQARVQGGAGGISINGRVAQFLYRSGLAFGEANQGLSRITEILDRE